MTLADRILPFMESGGVGNVSFTQQSNDQAWVDEFWSRTNSIMGRERLSACRMRGESGCWSMADA